MMKILSFITAILFNCVAGAAFGGFAGIDPVVGALGMNGLATVASFLPLESGVARVGVFRELWTGELVKALKGGLAGSWLDGIPDATSAVEHDVIHLVDVGVDPDVLINNTTYPIDLQALDDDDIAISLDKFQTKVTPVTDDELYAISYDKMQRVKDSHGNSIRIAKFKKAAHSFCAANSEAATPLLKTTGEIDPVTGRRKMTKDDLLRMKKAMDDMGADTIGRRLVLNSDHINDILGWSEAFNKQYNMDNVNGKVGRLYSFDIYEFYGNPVYTVDGTKKPLDAVAETGEFQASFAFYVPRVFKASGSTKMYYREAATDPQYQRNLINFRHWFIAMPKKTDCGVTMMSEYAIEG